MSEGAPTVSWIELGVIAKPHGVRGELRVHVFNPESTLLEELGEVFLIGDDDEDPALVEVESSRRGPNALLMRLQGVDGREQAEALRGYTLCVPREALPPLDDGEYYHADLIGLVAFQGEEQLGPIIDVLDYPSAECIKIERPGGSIEVPMLPKWLDRVDLQAGKVLLNDVSDIPLQRGR